MVEITAKEILPLIKGPVDKLFTSIGDELKQILSNRLIEYQSDSYKRNLYSKTFLNRSEAKHIDEFYEPLFIEEQKDKTSRLKEKKERISTANVVNLFKLSKKLVIVGSAGSGKTTLTKHLFVQCIRKSYKFPIKIELRYINDYSKENLYDYIVEEVFTFHKLSISRDNVNNLISKDSFVFFFDGFDELSASLRLRVARQIEEFTQRFPDNIYVVTSRPHTEAEFLPLFKNYKVSNLQKNEISNFIKKQLPKEEIDLAEKIIKTINKPESVMYAEYLKVPLLLAMFILTFQSYPDIPQERSDFYQQVFETLFLTHDSTSKLAYTRKRKTNLNKKQFEELLKTFAFLSFFENKPSFNIKYFNETLDLIKERNPTLIFENNDLIDDLIIAISIITKEGYSYSFPHRSLQEFFAANYIKKLNSTAKLKVYSRLMNNIFKDALEVSNNSNFFLLLNELDKHSLISYLTLPLTIESIKQVENNSDLAVVIFHYFRAYTVIRSTVSYKEMLIEPFMGLEKAIISMGFVPSSLLEARNMVQHLEETSNQDILDILRESINTFRANSSKLLLLLRTQLEFEDKIDNNITDLI
jgi:predicted NACHT family NTPase